MAIKLLPPELAARPALRERFLREARIAARLSHPNIVPIHAVEESGRLVWFVMAYVPGESLGARLRERGSLPPAEVARILRDVAWALGYAHGQGVVHRDVKPDNILLEAGGRRALIADFGIAAPVEDQGDSTEGSSGTVAYLSPEQASGERVDGRSDLYALGVVGYFALAGPAALPRHHASPTWSSASSPAPPPALATVAPHVPRALCRAIDRCLSPLATRPLPDWRGAGRGAGPARQQLRRAARSAPGVAGQKGKQRRVPSCCCSSSGAALAHRHRVRDRRPGRFGAATGWPCSWRCWSTVPVAVALCGPAAPDPASCWRPGYYHADLILALEQHVERRREELAFEYGSTPSAGGHDRQRRASCWRSGSASGR